MYRSLPQTRNNRKLIWWGIAFGILPDLVSFAPFFVAWFWQLLSGQAKGFRPEVFENSPWMQYAAESYNYSHSMVIFAAIFALIWLLRKKAPLVLLGWGLHIGIDIFSHTKEFYATPFLFPLFDFKVSVISWAHPAFMAINYTLLLVLYIFILPRINKSSRL